MEDEEHRKRLEGKSIAKEVAGRKEEKDEKCRG
jgi:hypothetical protein